MITNRAWSCLVVPGRAWSCLVVPGMSCLVCRAWYVAQSHQKVDQNLARVHVLGALGGVFRSLSIHTPPHTVSPMSALFAVCMVCMRGYLDKRWLHLVLSCPVQLHHRHLLDTRVSFWRARLLVAHVDLLHTFACCPRCPRLLLAPACFLPRLLIAPACMLRTFVCCPRLVYMHICLRA